MEEEKQLNSIQLQKLDDRALWYGSQYWQVPIVYLGGVGVMIVQVIDKPTVLPWAALVGGVAGLIILWHMWMIDKNFKRLVDEIIRLEKFLKVDNSISLKKSATQREEGSAEDHRLPMFMFQIATTSLLLFWAVKDLLAPFVKRLLASI